MTKYAQPEGYRPYAMEESKIDALEIRSSDALEATHAFASFARGILYDFWAIWKGNNDTHRILDEIDAPTADQGNGPLLPKRVRWLVDEYKRLKATADPNGSGTR